MIHPFTSEVKILLDTFPFAWLTSEPYRLTQVASEALSDTANQLFLSDASALELSLMYADGSLEMPQTPRLWMEKQRKLWNLQTLPIDREVCYRLSELPHHHGDPVDRLLVATALIEDLTILTSDDQIRKYPVATIW